jgi:hypothetical protein
MKTEVGRKGTQRNGWRKSASVLLVCLLAVPLPARETIQIHSTAAQVRAGDATLNQVAPASNTGGVGNLTVESRSSAGGGAPARNQRAVVEFDLTSLPNIAVKRATLVMHVTTPPSAGRTYGAYPLATVWRESDVTWNTRAATLAWTAAGGGGDIPGAATGTAAITNASTTAQFNISADVQKWYNGTPNYGTLIRDQTEGAGGAGFTTIFGSREGAAASAPELDLTFLQNVTNLAAVPGNAKITVSWSYPAPIGVENPGEPYTGVLILRRANLPVDKGSVPTDTVTPALCAVIGTGTVVFNNSTNATSFTDDNTDPCGGPANGTTYFYKVFLRDQANYYASQPIGNGSTFTAEISARPSAIATGLQNSIWVDATFSTTLAAPALDPGSVIAVGSQTSLLFGLDPNTRLRKYPPVSLGGPILSRSPVIDAADSSLGENVIYVADQDGLVYGVPTDTGQILWAVNPNNAAQVGAGTTNAFVGAGAVLVKSTSLLFNGGAWFLPAHDLLVLGTHNGATTTGNQILGIDGNTGATIWTTTGNAGGVPPIDIISSTPAIDYVNHAIWVTSRGGGAAGHNTLWKLNPNTGAVLAMAALGDTDSSPSLSFLSDVLFVGNNTGTLYAVDVATGQQVASFATGDGAIVSFPLVLQSPLANTYEVVFSGATAVHAVNYNKVSHTFSLAWNPAVAITGPSAPISFSGAGKVYVGSSNGFIHEIDLATGVDDYQMVVNTVNTGTGAAVGDPALDIILSRIYISTTDQRAYGFTFPFP